MNTVAEAALQVSGTGAANQVAAALLCVVTYRVPLEYRRSS